MIKKHGIVLGSKVVISAGMMIVMPKTLDKIRYRRAYGKRCNLNNPQSFSEKLLWLKYHTYRNNPLIMKLCDKYDVREYIKEKGLGNLLNELYFCTDDITSIHLASLPDAFVLKKSQGSGTNLICKNKNNLSEKELKDTLRVWSDENFHNDLEMARVGGIKRKELKRHYVCERYIGTQTELPYDYKFYCFNGQPMAVFYISGRDNKGNINACMLDMNWNELEIEGSYFGKVHEKPRKPDSFDKMKTAAAILSKEFPFVRVDFYEFNSNPIFGEMTFFPHDCVGSAEALINGQSMGELIAL